jgi:hypothetical protein
MAYTTNQLIASSYYTAGIVSRGFETVSGDQIADGLQWLNDVITDTTVNFGMIPYETTYPFNANTGQSKYPIPNLISIDTFTFYLNNVRFAMSYQQRNEYFGSSRVMDIQSLPFEWYFERQTGGGNLYVYFSPDQNYPMQIHGVFRLATVSLGQDLSSNISKIDLGVPTFYGLGGLIPSQLVVNGVDLSGAYPNIGALINFINTGVVPGVTASLNVNDFVLTSTTVPPTSINVRTSGYLGGTSFIGPVATATIANLVSTYNNAANGVGATLTASSPGALIIDGYTVNLGDIVLVKNQTNPAQNGSYSLTTLGTGFVEWVLTRTANYDESVQINEGNLFTVTNGTVNAGLTFVQTADVSVIGTSLITFAVFNTITFSNFSTIETPNYLIANPMGLDQFYITYLHYALTDRICTEYNYTVPPGVVKQLAEYQAWIKNQSRVMDMRVTKVSTLGERGNYSWAFINLGKGWTPPS